MRRSVATSFAIPCTCAARSRLPGAPDVAATPGHRCSHIGPEAMAEQEPVRRLTLIGQPPAPLEPQVAGEGLRLGRVSSASWRRKGKKWNQPRVAARSTG